MTRSMKLILFIAILLLSNTYVQNIASADSHILPRIGDGDETPATDGNITRIEYNSSVSFETTLHGNPTSVFATTNSTHLFIGFNISTTSFVSVNDTVPEVAGYELGYNNETHDWFAIVLDNNLDKDATSTTVGNSHSPDDVIVMDQYFEGVYDGYANGSTTFQSDFNQTFTHPITLNETNLIGNNGVNNTISSRNITSSEVIYEVVRPLTEVDINGSDFVLSKLDILQFSIFQFTDSYANDTFSSGNFDQTEWFSTRLNDTGTAPSLQSPVNSTISVYPKGVDTTQLDTISTLAEIYEFGYSVTSENIAEETLNGFDLNIIVIGEDASLLAEEIEAIYNYTRSGGNIMIFMEPGSTSSNLMDQFEIDYLENNVIVGQDNETETQLVINTFGQQISLQNNEGILTDRNFDNLTLYSSALNITNLLDDKNSLLLSQEFMMYDLFSAPADAIYDTNSNSTIEEGETFGNASLGIAIDLLKGGRVSIFPSLSLIQDGNITLNDNYLYLLKLLPWNAELRNTLKINSVETSRNQLTIEDTVSVTVNMTDTFNSSVTNGHVIVEVRSSGNLLQTVMLTQNDDIYTGVISFENDGNIELEITGYSDGQGFAEGESQYLLVTIIPNPFNDLSQISLITVIAFAASLIVFAMVMLRVRKI